MSRMRSLPGPARLWPGLALALAFALLLAACGSDSSSGPSADDRDLLQQVMLTIEDVPAGLQQGASNFETNEEAADAAADPEAALTRFEIWGRLLGFSATFVPGPEASSELVIGVEAEATLFEESAGARFWLDDRVAQAEEQVAAVQDGTSGALLDMEVTEVDAAAITPNAYWVRTSGFEPDAPSALRVDNQMLFQTERVGVFLRVEVIAQGVSDRTFYAAESAGLAQAIRDRIAAEFADHES